MMRAEKDQLELALDGNFGAHHGLALPGDGAVVAERENRERGLALPDTLRSSLVDQGQRLKIDAFR